MLLPSFSAFPLAYTTLPSSSVPHSPLCLALFLCQTWSGCGIRMHHAICCWLSTLPTTLFCGTETRAPSCGKRATLRTSSPFLLTPSTPPIWRVGEQHLTRPYFIHHFTFLHSRPHINVMSVYYSRSSCISESSSSIQNKVPYYHVNIFKPV